MWHRAAWTLLHDLDLRATSLLENSPRHRLRQWHPVFPDCLSIVLVPGTNSVHVNPCYPGQCLDSWDVWAGNDSRRKRLETTVSSRLELNSMGGSGREWGFCQIKLGDISVPFHLGAADMFPAEYSKGWGMGPALQAGLGGKRCPCMGQVALGCSKPWCCGFGGWGVTDESMCLWGPAARAGGLAGPACASDPNPCITAGAGATGAGLWCSSHSLQTWVLLSMRPAKPGDCFRSISGIPCSDSLRHERVKAVLHKCLRQSLFISTITFPGFGGWFSPWWCLCMPGPLARLGWQVPGTAPKM